MQIIWDEVYHGKVEHYITPRGPVFHVGKQHLNKWRSGFAATALMVIATFFIQDTDFHDPKQREDFAAAMLHHNHYLFSGNEDINHKMWTGIWRSPFVLQTFASHFNFVAGCSQIPKLDSEKITAQAALALAATAIAAHGNLQLKKLMSGSKPQKHAVLLKGDSGVTWEVIIPDGEPYGFNFQMWGETTRKLLQPIMALSNANFSTIVEETQCYVKVSAKGKERSTRSSGSNEDDNDDFQNLFEFQ
ncbi:hypothetical protein M404DRAFT_35229 [Pisolithus tinctorius Marx 270]|uniref:Uncharacterized protein n=1 Tax=Pisolithus tinctorius Marx 270 TaxID=870435 RepID=A0A0C3NEX5_PISTI|nr:hypothetical protein M404DRAFT_35229 [Pisolithus tinctorius Marx 270]